MMDSTDDSDADDISGWYYVSVDGDESFRPREYPWPESILVERVRTPGELYVASSKSQWVPEAGGVTLEHAVRPSEIDLFTDADPLIQFLIRDRDALRRAGVVDVVAMLGLFREGKDPQMNTELTHPHTTQQ